MTDQFPGYPRKLRRTDIRDGFESGAKELDDWIGRFALQDQRANSATTYVSCVDKLVIGYYSITVGAVAKHAAPTAISKGVPDQVACMVIPRLAVDRGWQGKNIGAALLKDALERSAFVSNAVAARAVLVHAPNDAARAFYASQLDFLPSPVNDLQLMIPMKEVQRIFGKDKLV